MNEARIVQFRTGDYGLQIIQIGLFGGEFGLSLLDPEFIELDPLKTFHIQKRKNATQACRTVARDDADYYLKLYTLASDIGEAVEA